MKKLAILHFLPLEYYPPITNLLNFIGKKPEIKTRIWSCHNIKERKQYQNDLVSISRVPFPDQKENTAVRLVKYWVYNLKSLLGLLLYKPQILMYYETYSAWPAWAYLKYFNSDARLFIHFHEYFTTDWYKNGMRLVKYYHHLEQSYLFTKAIWISQTNIHRQKLFHLDNSTLDSGKFYVMPNYPPEEWGIKKRQISNPPKNQFKLVYVGTVSMHSMFLQELCEYVKSFPDKMTLDIFAYNVEQESEQYLSRLNISNINFFEEGVEYDSIPGVLVGYDIGVIIHRGVNANYKYNETNKLFEYLACGLDVWVPSSIVSALPHVDEDAKPRVLALDFEKLNTYAEDYLFGKAIMTQRELNYYCEPIYENLFKAMINET